MSALRRPPPVLNIEPGSRELTHALTWPRLRIEGKHFRQLLSAVADGRIGLTLLFDPRAVWTPRQLPSDRSRIVLIADDDGNSRDPAEWRCSMSATAWARAAAVHGTGAQAAHYELAINTAQHVGRLLFVETDGVHLPAWVAWVRPRGIPITAFVPTGGEHPVEPAVRS